MSQNVIRTSQNIYLQRMMRRVTPILGAAIVILCLLILYNINLSRADALETEHAVATRQLSDALAAEFNHYAEDLHGIAQNRSVRDHISGDAPNVFAATDTMGNLIESHSDEYRRFDIVSPSGVVLLSRLNENGRSGLPIAGTDTTPAPFAEDEAFIAASRALTEDVFAGSPRLLRDEDGNVDDSLTLVIDFYTPVFQRSSAPIGVVRVEVNLQPLLSVIGLSTTGGSQAILTNLDGRHVVLVDALSRVMMDSNAVSNNYIRNFEALRGNITGNSFYEDLIAFDTQQTRRNYIAEASFPGAIYSGTQIAPNSLTGIAWRLYIIDNPLVVYGESIINSILVISLSVLGYVGGVWFIRRSLTPLTAPINEADLLVQRLTQQADLIDAPERQRVMMPLTASTLGEGMVASIRQVSNKLDDISKALTEQTERRNRDMQVAGRIGRESAAQSDLDVLAKRAINLICNELGFYHAQIFLLDDSETHAILRYSRGEAGQKMLERGHRIRIGTNTVIGTVTAQKRPVIVNDTGASGSHGFNPLLPETRAEMGLPLIIGEDVIGALDIQSRASSAFSEADIPTYQLLADQLAVAIYNTQLREQTARRLVQIDRLNRQLTRDAWQQMEDKLDLKQTYGSQDVAGSLSAPITIRGEVIGTLAADLPEGQDFTEGDQVILQSVAERVALAIENARLFQETQVSLSETSTLYQLSRLLNESNTLDDVLEAIIETVAPTVSGGQVWLFEDVPMRGQPDWMIAEVDINITPREAGISITGQRYKLSEFPLGSRLRGDTVEFVNDISKQITLSQNTIGLLASINAVAMAFIPLNIRGAWKGLITLEYPEVHFFNERERRIFQALIAQAGVAIDNRLLLQQTEDALSRQEQLYAASRIINTSQSLQDLVFAAVATASDNLIEYWLALLEGDTDRAGWTTRARIVAKSNMGTVDEVSEIHELNITENSPMRRREPEILVDPGEELTDVPEQVQWMRSMGLKFMAIFPLFSDNLPTALFYIVSQMTYDLSQDDYEVYRALTGQMSTQIQNRRLLERTETALNETRRLYVASRAISGAQDMSGIYDAIAGHLAMPFIQQRHITDEDYNMSITILLAKPQPTIDAPQLLYEYQWHSDPMIARGLPIGTVISQEDAPFGSLISKNDDSSLVYRDLDTVPEEFPMLREIFAQGNALSALATPLWSRQRWFGVMIVRTDHPQLLEESYIRFAQAIADQVAIAIENQSLLAETEFERARLNTVLATLPTGVLVLDPVTFEPRQHNARVEELLGQPVRYNEPFIAETYRMYRTGTNLGYPTEELPIYVAQRQNRQHLGDDIAVFHEIGQTDLLISAAPIYDSDGQQRAIVAAFQDISTLRSMENTMQENLRETVLLYETQRALSESETLDDLFDNIIMQLAMQQPADAYIVTSDEKGVLALARSLVQPLDNVHALQPILSNELVNINDIERATDIPQETRDLLASVGGHSVMILPLRSRSRLQPLGWLVIIDSEPEAFTGDQERTMTSVADMASTAIDNTYLVQSTQIALQETAALYTATTTISRARDIQELFDGIEASLMAMNPTMVAGFLQQGEDAVEMFRMGFEDQSERDALLATRLPQGVNVYFTTGTGKHEVDRLVGSIDGIQTLVIVNLHAKDTQSGRILIGFDHIDAMGENEQRFLSAIADSASVVIDNQLLLEQIQSTLQETSVLYQASKALLETNGPDDIINVIVNYLIEPHVNQVFIAILNTRQWDSSGASVEIVASWQSESDVNLTGVTLSPDQFPAWKQMSVDEVVTYNDIYDPELGLDELEQTSIESLDTRSLVVIPLRVSSRAIGVIWLGSREVHNYTDRDLRIFQAFAEQTSLTLEAERLLEQTEQRARQLETSAVISQSVGQILDLDVLLPQVVDLIKEQFAYDHVQVFLMDEEDNWAVLRASTGEAGKKLLGINHKLQKGSFSVIGRVTSSGTPTIALDTAAADVVHQPNPYLPMTRSEMALPMIIKGQVVGALDVQSNQPNAFNEEDTQALITLAAQIAIAIENARLYEESQRRAEDMGFLFEITTAAAAAESLGEALSKIADNVRESLRAEMVSIFLPQDYEDYEGNRKTMMEISAIALERDAIRRELEGIAAGDGENLIGMVASGLQPVIISNIDREVRYHSIVEGARSAIIAPISSGAQLVGLIVMESKRLNAYDNETLTLMLTLAGSLSAIIQNTLLLDRLRETNEQLREVDRLKSQFLASMSHELRTPLNSIIGFSRVMLKGIDGPLTEMQEQDLTTIYNSGNHLLNLINDILDQAKIEANELNLKFAYFDIKPMVESVKSIAIGMMKERPLRLEVEVAPNMPQAYGDDFRSRQILLNLVSNAIKFTVEGTVGIRAYAVEGAHGNMIRIDVIDSGIGIAEKDMPILFEQFRQVDSSLTRTVGGTGLGLPISKALAEMQGGEITVTSEVNVGSTFSVVIPCYEGAQEALERQRAEKRSQPVEPQLKKPQESNATGLIRRSDVERAKKAAQGETDDDKEDTQEFTVVPADTAKAPRRDQNMTQAIPIMNTKREVLLIEDNKEMVDQFRRILQREGYDVQTADHPAYAEAMVGQLRPNVVVMDINFAEGRGWDMLKSLKEREETFDIPIVITTMSDESERAYRLGAHTFLQRPFVPNDLVTAVLEAEKESQRERILIIDDQPEAIRLLTQLLSDHSDFKVFSAQSGDEGISLVARRRPDLIILDLRMPDKDGFAVLDELRGNPETAKIPVLVVTGDIDLSLSEQEQLSNIRILPKTDINEEEFQAFIDNVRNYLTNGR